jgi:hypothetical protein
MTRTIDRRRVLGLGATLLAFSLAACGGATATTAPVASIAPSPSTAATPVPTPAQSDAASTAAPSVTPGASLATTGRIEFADKGFAVTLPKGWTRIDLQAGDLEALIAAAGASNPALAQAYSAQIKAMLASGLVLFAFGPNPIAGTNVNILVVPSLGVSMDLLEQASKAQLKSVANGDIKSERVALPAGEALHLRYSVAAQGVPTSPSIDQYVVVTDSFQYIVSVTNAEATDAAAIAQSLELLD